MENKETTTILPQQPQRLSSIDAFRGFVMFLMLAQILKLSKVAKEFAADETYVGGIWRFLSFHQTHVEWTGCSLHDMIQPGFTFLVGVALPFSIAARIARGQTFNKMAVHAFMRVLILILLGVFLRSQSSSQTNWTFEDTLTQIGLGYGFVFLLGFSTLRAQIGAFFIILIGYWTAFAAYPLPGSDFDWTKTGITAEWEHNAIGFAAHWNKNTNLAWAFDNWFMNLFPRKAPYEFNSGGYQTLNFIPTIATMLLGLFAGNILRSNQSNEKKIGIFLLLGVGCLTAGWLCGYLGICPVVKRIWTPAWMLYSGGICFLFLTGFFLLADVLRCKKLFFPLMVIGANSIVAYCIANTRIHGYFIANLKIHLGNDYFKSYGECYEPLFLGAVVLLITWLILFYMYRNKIHVRI
ncbi:MAG: DUF5009 domain-containing protein [Planctomycetaceae bacterium]|nr:DUF5009 domain-containing protein [Planctomycetaceae bacterium]